MLISITIMVIISQQHFLYNSAIFISINATSIPAPTKHPPQISILISQYTIPATTGLDIPLLICAMFFPVSIIVSMVVLIFVNYIFVYCKFEIPNNKKWKLSFFTALANAPYELLIPYGQIASMIIDRMMF